MALLHHRRRRPAPGRLSRSPQRAFRSAVPSPTHPRNESEGNACRYARFDGPCFRIAAAAIDAGSLSHPHESSGPVAKSSSASSPRFFLVADSSAYVRHHIPKPKISTPEKCKPRSGVSRYRRRRAGRAGGRSRPPVSDELTVVAHVFSGDAPDSRPTDHLCAQQSNYPARCSPPLAAAVPVPDRAGRAAPGWSRRWRQNRELDNAAPNPRCRRPCSRPSAAAWCPRRTPDHWAHSAARAPASSGGSVPRAR